MITSKKIMIFDKFEQYMCGLKRVKVKLTKNVDKLSTINSIRWLWNWNYISDNILRQLSLCYW